MIFERTKVIFAADRFIKDIERKNYKSINNINNDIIDNVNNSIFQFSKIILLF